MEENSKKPKPLKAFRLSDGTIKTLDSVAKRHHITPAKVITVLVKAYYSGVFDDDETISEKLDALFELAKEM
jgi:hypothetical protein